VSYLPLNQQQTTSSNSPRKFQWKNWLTPLRQHLDRLEIRNEAVAHLLCRLIPTQCPFERDLYWFGRKVAHIPPLCKLNPFYEEVVGLRFRALCYLADECEQDISCYC
jgi:hypothetical protein